MTIAVERKYEEEIAQLQYESGMYQSLYENAAAQRGALESAILSYLATFDRCGGSESVSAGEFAEGRQRMRDLVGGSKQP